MKASIVPALLCALGVTGLHAQTASTTGKANPPERFTQLDTDGDGRISPDEWKAGQPANMKSDPAAMFRGLDKDGDGTVSAAELHAGGMDRPLRGAANPQNGQSGGPPGDRPARPHEATGSGNDHPAGERGRTAGSLGGVRGGMGAPGGIGGAGRIGGAGGIGDPAGGAGGAAGSRGGGGHR